MNMSANRLWVVLYLLFLVLARPPQTAAEPNPIQDFRLWTPVYLTAPLGKRIKAYMEVNPRFSDDASKLDQLILRPALGYQLTSSLSVWQGYAWVTNYEPGFSQEHRIFQQLIYAHTFPTLKILSRSRLEERWIQNAVGTSIRARTMLRGDLPVPRLSGFSLVAYDEIFVNLNTINHGPESGFDQNRTFLGFNYQFTSNLSLDMGYQLQITNNARPHLINTANHILLLQLFITLS
ncbi:MAG: DUF2490 domain-containing protein [Nitrospira sp.]|nr:DUF2490 domain-containing protein [Nitrospira sp.]MCA9480556.1 DUF2490 domain-containing protein [Nitrospira sp.]